MKTKILTGIYVGILILIIFLADRRETQYLFRFIWNLPFGDKVGHFLLMGIFSFLLNLVLNARGFRLGRISFLWGTLIVLAVVTIEEFSQLFVRGRTFDVGDLAADFLGILLFGEFARWVVRRKQASQS
jgi:VanZ family protein